jgi:hypothetical protein
MNLRQPKPAGLPKQPQAYESGKQSPTNYHCDSADGKIKGTPPNPNLSCEDPRMNTSGNEKF